MKENKKINQSKSQTKIAKDLVKREKAAVSQSKTRIAKQKTVRFPKLLIILIASLIVLVIGAVLIFNISQLVKTNDNKQQFVQLRTMIEQIEATGALSASGTEWIQSEHCISTPINNFDLTYKARKEWRCSDTAQRPLTASEKRDDIQMRLASVVGDHFDIKKRYTSEEGAIVLETSQGMRCSVHFGLEGEYGELGGVIVGCSDGAYKPWYHKGVL